jgi:hypothetical protein
LGPTEERRHAGKVAALTSECNGRPNDGC